MVIMGKTKPKQPSENDDTEDDAQSLPRTRRQAKLQTTKQEDTTSDEDESPAPAPPPKTKAAPKPRKVVAPSSESPPVETPDTTTLAPHLRKRKGGNKRRFTHEYCLTCQHYGRACGGRREDQDGCAICRDPNREKGEKLRECLWANPAAGITTYEEARVAHKEAQVEKRARDKAKAQELKRTNAEQSNTGKNSSSVPKVSVGRGPPPPVRRPLDVVPPPSATIRSPTYFIPPVLNRQNDDSETITVETPTVAPSPTMSHLPGINGELGPKIHRPTVIKLRVNNPSDRESVDPLLTPRLSESSQTARPDRQLPPSSKPLSFVPPPIPHVPPYYDFQIQAWRYPSEPGTYVARSDIPSASHPAYQSAYGHPPAFTVATSSTVVPPSDVPPSTPSTNCIKTRPLDRSGTPCKKWARTGSDVTTTVSGYALELKGWKTEEANVNNCAIDETQDDISTSDLSSVIDVDDPREFEKAVRDAGIRASPSLKSSPLPHAIVLKEEQDYVMVHNSNEEAEEKQEDGEEEDEDRLQTQINRMAREAKMKFTTHSRNPSKSDVQVTRPKIVLRASMTSMNNTNPTNIRTRAESTEEACKDEDSSTDDEGPLKRLPLEIRNKLNRNTTTFIRISDTETITVRPEHFKGESLPAQDDSRSVDGDTASLPPWTRRKSSRNSGEESGQKRKHNGANDNSDSVIEDDDDNEGMEEEEDEEDDDETVARENGDKDVEMLEA